MNISSFFKKPEYYFRPTKIIKRLGIKKTGIVVKKMPWNTLLEVDVNEAIGKSINIFGIYDIAVSEVLWRIIKPGDFVLDIGANIGYTANLCSFRTGVNGKVWAFEPNPNLHSRLRKNITFMGNNVELFPFGLSDAEKNGFLVFPDVYKNNEGVAFIGSGEEKNSIKVELKKLDDLISDSKIVNVLKIDVEGHELSVFKGAEKILNRRGIENIVFEDDKPYPSPVADFLLEKGYKIFRIEKGWFTLLLKDPSSPSEITYWEPTNYIAVLDEKKLRNQIKGFFYNCL